MGASAVEPLISTQALDLSATILVVEDDEPIRLAVSELLEAEGYHVVTACDGAEALAALGRMVPALVVTDLQMPKIDGRELCARLRSDRRTCEVPVIVLTAAHRVEGLTGRCDAVIRKPFDVDVLLETIAQFIRPTLPPRPPNSTPSVRLTLGPARPAFVLYVTSGTTSSVRAERTVRAVIGARNALLEVVDVSLDERRAREDGIAMTPTLVRSSGSRREVFVGDLSEAALVDEFVTESG